MFRIALLTGFYVCIGSISFSQEALIEPSFGIKWTDTIEETIARYPEAEVEEVEDLTRLTISGAANDSFPSNTDFTSLFFQKGMDW